MADLDLDALERLARAADADADVEDGADTLIVRFSEVGREYIGATTPHVVLALCSEVRRLRRALADIAHGEGGDTQAHDWDEFWQSVRRRADAALQGGE